MAKLSELLGAVLKDILQAGATADALTVDLMQQYRQHPLLSQLPVPRVRLGDISVTLRFALDAHTEPEYQEEDLDEARELLRKRLAEVAAVATFRDALHGQLDAKSVIKKLRAVVRALPDPNLQLVAALKGNPRDLVGQAVEYVVAAKAQSPPEIKRMLPKLPGLRELARPAVEKVIGQLMPTLRGMAAAKGVSRMDLDIEVRSEALAQHRDSDIHELQIQLRLEELEALPVPEKPPEDEG